jgi:arylsulfatase A-like enzyme
MYHGLWEKGGAAHYDDVMVWEAQKLITNGSLREPFCLFLPLVFPHPPYYVEEPYFSMYAPERMDDPVPARLPGKPSFMDLHHEYSGLSRCEPEHIRKMRAVYYGMITRTDALLGQLVATLKEAGLYDRTAIVFWSDHGNYTGDYGVPCKWWTGFEDALIRVPCAIKLPGQARTGISNALVQSIDVAATILELAGARSTWTHFGRSLMPILQGEANTCREAVFAESGFNPALESVFMLDRSKGAFLEDQPPTWAYYQWLRMMREHPDTYAWCCMVRTERWKYVWRLAERHELYDLAADSREENNLLYSSPEQHRGILSELRGRLLDWAILTSGVVSPEKDLFDHLKVR